MDFYIDIGFAVLLRLLKDRREAPKWRAAFAKLYNAVGHAFVPDHKDWDGSPKAQL